MLNNTFSEWKSILSQFDNFCHGVLQEMGIGQREELLLTLVMQKWGGQNSYHSAPVKLRFGSVTYDESLSHKVLETLPCEIAYLRLVGDMSKQNCLRVEMQWERDDIKIEWSCRNIQVLENTR